MNVFSYELDLLPQSVWHFFSATAEAKSNFVFLQEIGHFFTQKKYFTTRQGLDSFLVKITISGGGILEYNGHTEKVGVGHFFWIDCMESQHYYTDPNIGNWEVLWVHFSGATARGYYEAFCKAQIGCPVKKVPEGSPMQNLLETLINRVASGDSHESANQNLFDADIQISGILTQFMASCCSTKESAGELPASIPPIVQEIRSFLAANYDQKITLEFLANKYNLDPFYLQKQFKRHIGQSPSQYVIYLRMTHAKILMRTTGKQINEIAASVGIDNVSLFTRQFKKLEGVAPLQYRKNWSALWIDH